MNALYGLSNITNRVQKDRPKRGATPIVHIRGRMLDHIVKARSGVGKLDPMSDATKAVHGGERRPGPEGSVVYPIYQSTVYASKRDGDIDYIRSSNTPSQIYLHDKLAALEGAEAAIATASGMSAMTATLAAFLRNGDHVVAANGLYGGTHAYLSQYAQRVGVGHTFVDVHQQDSWAESLTARSKIFIVESISNPMMRIPDLEAVAAFARQHGLISVIDNTFATPMNLRPLELGFDICFHSATKYLNGHSDIVAGCVLGSAPLIEEISRTLNQLGGSLDPHAGFLLARGLKTLALRMERHNENAQKLAEFLSGHPSVTEVSYPGLPEHPDHARGKSLMRGFGGMLSFRIKDATAAKVDTIVALLQLATVATSLGSVETLVTRPAATSHATLSLEERESIGITDDLIRVSCGIEGADDLIGDFEQALG